MCDKSTFCDNRCTVTIGTANGPVDCDACLALEIIDLNALGICTVASCCGHGKQPPSLGVADEDIGKMEALGYAHEDDPFNSALFLARSPV